MRRQGASKEQILEVVQELEKLKAARRANPVSSKAPSRYQRRRTLQNAERAGVFRRWLCDKFGVEVLRCGAGILDVAGGHGGLAFELLNLDDVPCTIVDPRPVEPGFKRLERKWRVLGKGEPPPDAEDDALTAVALQSARDPSTPEARTIAARLVHRDWRLARARDAQSRRPAHWRLCWEPELYNVPLHAPPSEAVLQGLGGHIDALLESASGMRWTRKGLVAAGSDAELASMPLEAALGAADAEDSDDESVSAAAAGAAESSATAEPAEQYPADAVAAAVPPSSDGATPLAASDVWRTLAECSLIAGMHADGATEGIIDFALAAGKPFAVVPCCVYSNLAREVRRDATTGLKMSTMSYVQFVRYLVAKAPKEIRTATLPFEGKNVVVYRLPAGAMCAECDHAESTEQPAPVPAGWTSTTQARVETASKGRTPASDPSRGRRKDDGGDGTEDAL